MKTQTRTLTLPALAFSLFTAAPVFSQSLPTTNTVVSLTLAWNAASVAIGDTVTNYTVFYGTNSGASSGAYPSNLAVGTNLSAVLNLPLGQTYYFTVTATDTNSITSPFANEISAPTFSMVGAPPGLHVVGMILKP